LNAAQSTWFKDDLKKPLHLHATAFKTSKLELEPPLERLGNVTGTNAAGADFNGSDAAVSDRFNLLKVRIPNGTGFVVGMAYVVAEGRTFTTDFAYS